jgi:hypothetical protein
MLKRLLLFTLLMVPAAVLAQDDPAPDVDVPDLTQTYDGRGRLNDFTLNYPEGWYTLDGIPVTRFISLNVISSVQVGIRNRIAEGEEAIVLAVAGGRIDRWNTLEAGATAEAVLTAFLENLGGDDQFGSPPEGEDFDEADYDIVIEEMTFNGYEAARLSYVPIDPDADTDSAFTAYAILLDDNRFVAVLTLTSDIPLEEAQPTIEAILDTVTLAE